MDGNRRGAIIADLILLVGVHSTYVLSNHCIVGDFIQIIFLSVIEFSIAVSYTKCCVLSFCDGLGDSFPILEYSYLLWNPYNRLL